MNHHSEHKSDEFLRKEDPIAFFDGMDIRMGNRETISIFMSESTYCRVMEAERYFVGVDKGIQVLGTICSL